MGVASHVVREATFSSTSRLGIYARSERCAWFNTLCQRMLLTRHNRSILSAFVCLLPFTCHPSSTRTRFDTPVECVRPPDKIMVFVRRGPVWNKLENTVNAVTPHSPPNIHTYNNNNNNNNATRRVRTNPISWPLLKSMPETHSQQREL